ncbi:ARPP-2 domain-containing protein [Sphaerisporangium dianthi]|uniref:ARG and Rhodanese-Phosphatase-superfamily-associated domain-containing protein n=1 Tax=Sphaerisporangium dianthi TaxID=1436120 RepID=A0ABV9CFI8_9ACTN
MIELSGLMTRPAQTWGSVRLVPLVRPEPIKDLRLHPVVYGDELSMVSLPDKTVYTAYIPHAFVASWTGDGTPAATYGTQLGRPLRHMGIRTRRRMARRVEKNRLRFLPLHLALEGFLALHFGGPTVAWEEWTHQAVAHGLSPRVEEAYTGAEVRGLDDALRVFEIYAGQCGVLLYVGDTLAAAFVVPHPEDYRALHPTLVRDLYGELIYQYALFHPARDVPVAIDEAAVSSLADLRAQATRCEREWADFHDSVMAAGLRAAPDREEVVYRLGRFTLRRFLPSFERQRENHIGEMITDESGRLAYLKTFRLSEAQSRRGHLLSVLARHDWHLPSAAAALGTDQAALGLRLERAGFGHLLRQDVLDAYRKAGRP